MRAAIIIEVELRIVFSFYRGVLNTLVALDHMERLSSDPAFRPAFNQLLDLRGVTRIDLTAEEIRKLAERTIFDKTSRRAILVSSDLQFGLARMFGTYRDALGEPSIGVFRTVAEAANWIDCDEEAASKYLERVRAQFEAEAGEPNIAS